MSENIFSILEKKPVSEKKRGLHLKISGEKPTQLDIIFEDRRGSDYNGERFRKNMREKYFKPKSIVEKLIEKDHSLEFSVPRIREELQDSMEENAKIFRTEESLEKQTKILTDLRDRYQNVTISDKGKVFNTELLEAIELEYLLDMSDTTVASALHRKESRGAHSRVDHVERDDENWLKHSFAFKNGESVKLEYKNVELGNYEPKERKY